jgi:hypothetical protein
MIGALMVTFRLYARGTHIVANAGLSTNLSTIKSLGFGSANPITTISWLDKPVSGEGALIWNSTVVNLPKLVLSVIYFA